MELKLSIVNYLYPRCNLLIVPYGIETGDLQLNLAVSGLLIVPYGIETGDYPEWTWPLRLLIVPYGIETSMSNLSH